MTKVVTHDLDAPGYTGDEAPQHIEWTHVNRNFDGGIQPKGVFTTDPRHKSISGFI
ncbi:MAG: hypothetical protein IPH82_05995 [Chloroflexi bacterium]|nr:hypothetical protein [Chloroflexota bacterium]